MIDGIIYKLFCKDYDDCYIGSTTDFNTRKRKHKNDCNNKNSKNYNLKVYKFIREHNGFDSWEFEVLEQNEYENKYLLRDREANFVKILKSTLNSQIPNRTLEDNKEYRKEYDKKYRENNIDKIKQYREDKILCEVCNCYIRRHGLSEHKKTKKHIKNLNKS